MTNDEQRKEMRRYLEGVSRKPRCRILSLRATGQIQENLVGAGSRCCQYGSQEKRNTRDGPHEHFRRLQLAQTPGEFWNGYQRLHQRTSLARMLGIVWAVSCTRFLAREYQASQRIPMNAQRRSRTRRVRARPRPSMGENPIRANAEIAAPSSDPSRAGIHPLSIFSPLVTPSMTRTVKK